MTRYRTIVADPPWDYGHDKAPVNVGNEQKYARLTYRSMPFEALCELPVADWADENCRMFLWTTNRHLPIAFDVMKSWGFSYRQCLVWEKSRSTPVGSVAPNRCEFILVGRRGSPESLGRLASSVFKTAAQPHSRKPDCLQDYVEAISPGPYLELFARRQRLGWDTYGDEALGHVEIAGQS